MANSLENVIVASAAEAQKRYTKMSGGYWLWHGPESYLQNFVASAIHAKEGFNVFVDSSGKKVASAIGPKKGRKPKNHSKRFDISVWNKSSASLRAVIEVKRAWNFASLEGDVVKIRAAQCQSNPPKAGYILVYSESKRRPTLEKRFSAWAARSKIELILEHTERDELAGWSWGVALFRV